MSGLDKAFEQQAAGATQQMKAQLRAEVDPATYRAILHVAQQVLAQLPMHEPLGTLTAGLMLAATAQMEGAANATRLVRE